MSVRLEKAGGGHSVVGITVLSLVVLLAASQSARSTSPEELLARRLRRGPGVSNHPVGVIPSSAIRIPRGWPLAPDGSITCTTCHRALPSLDGRGEPDLRALSSDDSSGKSFCTNCHQEQGHRSATAMHWLALDRAHFMHADMEDETTGGTRQDSAGACLSCHDGVSAPDVAYQTPGGRRGGNWDPAMNHPVGVPYPRAGKRGMEMPLRPVSSLPTTVRLPGGAVSCVSCHDLYASKPALLTVPIEGSRLCMTCHQAD